MRLLEKAIKDKGKVLVGDVLKVDAIINQQIDPLLIELLGDEFYDHFKTKPITKILTVEASGIAPALVCALRFRVPLVFLKKTRPSTMIDPLTTEVFSYTKNMPCTLCVEREFIKEDDHILFIDDFLANGETFKGVERIVSQVNAHIDGVGILIEKAFQKGHEYIVERGYDLYSLASIKAFENGEVIF